MCGSFCWQTGRCQWEWNMHPKFLGLFLGEPKALLMARQIYVNHKCLYGMIEKYVAHKCQCEFMELLFKKYPLIHQSFAEFKLFFRRGNKLLKLNRCFISFYKQDTIGNLISSFVQCTCHTMMGNSRGRSET